MLYFQRQRADRRPKSKGVGFVAANPTKRPFLAEILAQAAGKPARNQARTILQQPRVPVCVPSPTARALRLPRHWFLQCTRPIHSAPAKTSTVHFFRGARRTGSERRQSAARGSSSSELPPLAASLPTKDAHAAKAASALRPLPGFLGCPHWPSSQRTTATAQPHGPSALSFSPAGSSLPALNGSRLPCRA